MAKSIQEMRLWPSQNFVHSLLVPAKFVALTQSINGLLLAGDYTGLLIFYLVKA